MSSKLSGARTPSTWRWNHAVTPAASMPGDAMDGRMLRAAAVTGDHRGDREAEMGDPPGQVDVQPARDAARERRDDDLVELAGREGLLDGVHRFVAPRDRAVDRTAGGL